MPRKGHVVQHEPTKPTAVGNGVGAGVGVGVGAGVGAGVAHAPMFAAHMPFVQHTSVRENGVAQLASVGKVPFLA